MEHETVGTASLIGRTLRLYNPQLSMVDYEFT